MGEVNGETSLSWNSAVVAEDKDDDGRARWRVCRGGVNDETMNASPCGKRSALALVLAQSHGVVEVVEVFESSWKLAAIRTSTTALELGDLARCSSAGETDVGKGYDSGCAQETLSKRRGRGAYHVVPVVLC